MDARLHEAAIRGDVASLLDLLRHNEDFLDMTHDAIANENPLHVAAQLGHVGFARVVLYKKPEYARKLNSQGQSPLHLASGAGHVEVVKLLLEEDAGVCFVRDKRGRTPLHIAARKGRVEVLKELVLAEPTAAWVQTEQGEPILHLCASNGQFEALKMLIALIPDDDFVNMKDDAENSILHLLAAEIQTEVIKSLLSNRGLDVNSLNMNNYTPLDALVEAPRRSSGHKKCKRILRGAGGRRAKEIFGALAQPNKKNWNTASTLMVVAILSATVTFQAALNPPGGVWQDDYPPLLSPGDNITEISKWKDDNEEYIKKYRHFAGRAVMSSEDPLVYLLFSFSNQIGFLASASIIFLLISGFNLKRKVWAMTFAMWISIGSMFFSYGLSLRFLSKNYSQGVTNLYIVMNVMPILAAALVGALVTARLVRLGAKRAKPLCKKIKERIMHLERRADSDGAAIEVSMDRTPFP